MYLLANKNDEFKAGEGNFVIEIPREKPAQKIQNILSDYLSTSNHICRKHSLSLSLSSTHIHSFSIPHRGTNWLCGESIKSYGASGHLESHTRTSKIGRN